MWTMLIIMKSKISILKHSIKVIRLFTKYGWIQLNSQKVTIFNL